MVDSTKTSVALLGFHEIAHHVLGHADRSFPNTATASGLLPARQDEDAADRWAFRKFLELELPPTTSMPYINNAHFLR
jgi:hypothetical protein